MNKNLLTYYEGRMDKCASSAARYAELGCISQSIDYIMDAIHYATECCVMSTNKDEFDRFNEKRLELRHKVGLMAANLTHYPEVGKEVIQHLK